MIFNMNGYIFLATNSEFPDNTILIGKSEIDPRYLKNISNVETKKKSQIKYFAYIEDYDLVHFSLDLRFKNLKKSSDDFFFDCSILEAIRNLKELSNILSEKSYFEKKHIYRDHEKRKAEKISKEVTEILSKEADTQNNLKINENKINNDDGFNKKLPTSFAHKIHEDRKITMKTKPTLEQIKLIAEDQKKIDKLILNKSKRNEGLSGGMCFFLFVIGLLVIGTLAIPFSDRSGSGTPYPGSGRDNPMHEGR